MPNAIILGTGSCVPDKVLPNTHFERVGSNDAWIQERLGIKERRVVDGQTTSDIATGAALQKLHLNKFFKQLHRVAETNFKDLLG